MPLSTKEKLKIALLIACIVSLGALAFSWFVNRESESCGPDWGTLNVHVTNAYGTPLRNANVSLYLLTDIVRTGLTDGSGDLSFGHLHYDSYCVTATKEGCQPGSQNIYFEKHGKTITFALAYLNFTLSLEVTNQGTGVGIPNASLLVYRYNYGEEYEAVQGLTNATGGIAFLELEYDEYSIVVSKSGFFNDSRLLFLNSNITFSIPLIPIPGLPSTPLLHPIAPNPSITGNILLNWSAGTEAAIFYVFRALSPINSTAGLIPLAVVWTTTYEDRLLTNGTYYYGIVARNNQGNSSLSNCECVVAALPAGTYPPYQNIVLMVIIGAIFGALLIYGILERRSQLERRKYKTAFKFRNREISDDAAPAATGSVKPTLQNQPDIFEGITYVVMVLFFLAVFQNITLLGSTLESERIIATQYLAIAALGTAGLAMRAIYDHIPIQDREGNIIGIGLTQTVHQAKNPSTLFQSLFYFAIAFGVQVLLSFVVMALPLSIFAPKFNMMVMGIIGAVGEELFFSYFATGLLFNKIKWFAIPVASIVFVWYHWVVYQTLAALIYVAIMRAVYSTVYILSRRLSSVMLAHVLNNLLVGLRM